VVDLIMYIFLSDSRPRSSNAGYSEGYNQRIQQAFRNYNPNATQLEGNLYGVVYYFFIPNKNKPDADNISKKIWDSLNTIAYLDDKSIRLRIAGVFDLISESIETLKIPQSVLDDFLGMIDEGKEHILYVEIGSLDYSLFEFEYEINLNEV
jgi:hypothetical protein